MPQAELSSFVVWNSDSPVARPNSHAANVSRSLFQCYKTSVSYHSMCKFRKKRYQNLSAKNSPFLWELANKNIFLIYFYPLKSC